MDYIEQVEKLYKYFEFNLEFDLMRSLIDLKHNYNNDLNLIGCFIKDYLTVVNYGSVSEDNNIYNDFVMFFENSNARSEEIIDDLLNYSNYYLKIVFEDIKDSYALSAISTINACFAIEYYPLIMKLLDEYYFEQIDIKKLNMILKSITDIAINKLENPDDEGLNNLEAGIKDLVYNNSVVYERISV